MKTAAFFKAISNPPKERILFKLVRWKERTSSRFAKNVTILALQERGSGGYYREREMVWRDAGKADSFDALQLTTTCL
jgi:hypothetical protein